jgi:hypothetical protein
MALIGFRLWYYHDILPNTVYAKSVPVVADLWGYRQKARAGCATCSIFSWMAGSTSGFRCWLRAGMGAARNLGRIEERRESKELALAWNSRGIQLIFVVLSGGNVFLRYRFLSGCTRSSV